MFSNSDALLPFTQQGPQPLYPPTEGGCTHLPKKGDRQTGKFVEDGVVRSVGVSIATIQKPTPVRGCRHPAIPPRHPQKKRRGNRGPRPPSGRPAGNGLVRSCKPINCKRIEGSTARSDSSEDTASTAKDNSSKPIRRAPDCVARLRPCWPRVASGAQLPDRVAKVANSRRNQNNS